METKELCIGTPPAAASPCKAAAAANSLDEACKQGDEQALRLQSAALSKASEAADASPDMRAVESKSVQARLLAQNAMMSKFGNNRDGPSCQRCLGSLTGPSNQPITAVAQSSNSLHSEAAHTGAIQAICTIPVSDSATTASTSSTAEPVAAIITCSADGTVKTWSAAKLEAVHDYKPECLIDNLVVVENTLYGNIVLGYGKACGTSVYVYNVGTGSETRIWTDVEQRFIPGSERMGYITHIAVHHELLHSDVAFRKLRYYGPGKVIDLEKNIIIGTSTGAVLCLPLLQGQFEVYHNHALWTAESSSTEANNTIYIIVGQFEVYHNHALWTAESSSTEANNTDLGSGETRIISTLPRSLQLLTVCSNGLVAVVLAGSNDVEILQSRQQDRIKRKVVRYIRGPPVSIAENTIDTISAIQFVHEVLYVVHKHDSIVHVYDILTGSEVCKPTSISINGAALSSVHMNDQYKQSQFTIVKGASSTLHYWQTHAPKSDKHFIEAAQCDLSTADWDDSACSYARLLRCIHERDATITECCELIQWAVRLNTTTVPVLHAAVKLDFV
eukprot:17265-Heterococcus_DN1.PRE.1